MLCLNYFNPLQDQEEKYMQSFHMLCIVSHQVPFSLVLGEIHALYEAQGASGDYEAQGASGNYEARGASGNYQAWGGSGNYEAWGASGVKYKA